MRGVMPRFVQIKYKKKFFLFFFRLIGVNFQKLFYNAREFNGYLLSSSKPAKCSKVNSSLIFKRFLKFEKNSI